MTAYNDLQGIAEKLIRGVPLFRGLTVIALLDFLKTGQEIRHERGETIFREGDASRDMYVVLRGKVEIERHAHEHRFELFGPFTSGNCFGEMAWADGMPRSATAKAAEPVILLAFSDEDIARADDQISSIMLLNLARLIADRCHRLDQRISSYLKADCFNKGCLHKPITDVLSAADIHRLEGIGKRLDLPAGSQLLWEGNTGKSLYVVLDGELDVVSHRGDTPWHLAGLHRGALFGEIAYLLDAVPRTASIIVKEKAGARVLRLERSVMERESGMANLLHRAIARQLSSRLRIYNDVLGLVLMQGCHVSPECPRKWVAQAA